VMRLVGVTELQGFFFSQAVPAEQIGPLRDAFRTANGELKQALPADLRSQRRS